MCVCSHYYHHIIAMTTTIITNIFQVLASWDALCEVLYVHDFISLSSPYFQENVIRSAPDQKYLNMQVALGGRISPNNIGQQVSCCYLNQWRKYLHSFSLFFRVSSRKRKSGWERGGGGRSVKITAFGEGGRRVSI